MTTVLLSKWTNAFYGFAKLKFGHLSHLLTVEPTLPVLLTITRPTKNQLLLGMFDYVTILFAYLKFENRLRLSTPRPLIISFTSQSYTRSSYPEGNFGRNQLPDGSMSLSLQYSSATSDLHVSTVRDPPSEVTLTSIYSSIDHHLSGLNIYN